MEYLNETLIYILDGGGRDEQQRHNLVKYRIICTDLRYAMKNDNVRRFCQTLENNSWLNADIRFKYQKSFVIMAMRRNCV